MPMPPHIEEYNLDGFSVNYVNGVTVTVSRDGKSGVGRSTESEADAFDKAIEALDGKDVDLDAKPEPENVFGSLTSPDAEPAAPDPEEGDETVEKGVAEAGVNPDSENPEDLDAEPPHVFDLDADPNPFGPR